MNSIYQNVFLFTFSFNSMLIAKVVLEPSEVKELQPPSGFTVSHPDLSAPSSKIRRRETAGKMYTPIVDITNFFLSSGENLSLKFVVWKLW